MNNVRTRKVASRRWIGTAVMVLLFASAALHAQILKDKKTPSPQQAGSHQAPAQAPARPAPTQAPARQAPTQAPVRQAPTQAPVRQTPTQAPTQAPVRQTPSQPTPNTGQTGRQSGGQTTPPNTGQFGRQNTGQTASPNTGQPGRQNTGQTASPNTGQFGRQNTGQTNTGQQGRQNGGQTGGQNTGQQFGRQSGGQSGGQNTGQQFGRQGGGQSGSQNTGQQFGRPNGGQTGGRQSGQNGPGQTIRTSNGGMVNRDQSGRVREVRTPGGAVITHAPNGARRVEVSRGNQRFVSSAGGRGGYAERPMTGRGQGYVQRTYYSHGQAYARIYRPVTFRGVALNIYTPVRFYRPGFYAYAYSPWITPVSYSWGWGGSPWFGFYGGYFSPYRVYAGPAFWLTDYLFAMTLQEAYQERLDAGLQGSAYAAGPVGLTPDVKQAVADEVHRQLDLERMQGQSNAADMAPIFADNIPHVFVVSSSLMVDDRGPGCAVSEGDVLQLRPGSSNGAVADTVVLASKFGDCRRGALVSVQLQDLQEMQNHMQATVDQGLAELQSRQGRGGLPALPAAVAAPPVDSPIAAAVQPDANVATELSQAAQEADRGEQDVVSQSAAAAGNAAGPVTISLGQSMADVESMNGKPDKIIDLGAKKIYMYKDLKITFTDGKVSDVQ